MEESGEDIDPDDQVPPPSDVATTVLDEIIGTSFTEKQLGNGYATFPSKPYDKKKLVAKAKKVFNALKEKNSSSEKTLRGRVLR